MELVLKNIQKAYHGRTVLAGLSLSVAKGEFHVLLGHSGCGKTTSLSIIAGLVKPDHGRVIIGGKDVGHLPPGGRGIGFIFQDYALFPHLTVCENIAYGLGVKRMKKSRIKERVTHYLKRVSLEDLKDHFPHQLSGGQKQRTALARALVQEPEILLMDEPMSNLDVLTKKKIGSELKALQKETGTTAIVVTHNQEEAFSLGNTVSVLNGGRIEQMDRAAELFDHPRTEFVARFLGTNNILQACVAALTPGEAILHVNPDGPEPAASIRVRRYPLFEKRKSVNLCLHPGKIVLEKKDNRPVDGRFNRLEGRIARITPGLHAVRVEIDAGGLVLNADVAPERFAFRLHEDVWVCFRPDALHPLCGKSCREAQSLRKCSNWH